MPDRTSLLDELRTQYEAARQSATDHSNVEGFRDIDARMRKAFQWLEKAVTYLDGVKPAVDHRLPAGCVTRHAAKLPIFPAQIDTARSTCTIMDCIMLGQVWWD